MRAKLPMIFVVLLALMVALAGCGGNGGEASDQAAEDIEENKGPLMDENISTHESNVSDKSILGSRVSDSDVWAPLLEVDQAAWDNIIDEGREMEAEFVLFTGDMPRNDFPYPAYPEAYAVRAMESSGTINGVEYHYLTVTLLTDCLPDEVVSFYRERLDGWSINESFGFFVFSKQGSDQKDRMSDALVQIFPVDEMLHELLLMINPETNTIIEVIHPL